jgi:hypothetical protein
MHDGNMEALRGRSDELVRTKVLDSTERLMISLSG